MARPTTNYWSNPVYKQLVKAIIASPHDTSLRYAFVDWLLEQREQGAHDRATFISACLENDWRSAQKGFDLKIAAPEVRWPKGVYVLWIQGKRLIFQVADPRATNQDVAVIYGVNGFIHRIGIDMGNFLPIARQLGQSQPLLDMSILGKYPGITRQRSTEILYSYWRRNEGPWHLSVPAGIWDCLEPTMIIGNRALYESRQGDEAAEHDLVQACLKYAKS